MPDYVPETLGVSPKSLNYGEHSSSKIDPSEIMSEFREAEFKEEYLAYVCEDSSELCGVWELLRERSESADEILKALGISLVKRKAVQNFKTRVEIKPVNSVKGRAAVKMVTHFPFQYKKEGEVLLDFHPFDYEDTDTGKWTTQAITVGGRLMQKRTSVKGTMYDIRGTFLRDPKGLAKDGLLQLFQWTYINPSGRKYTCERWFQKQSNV